METGDARKRREELREQQAEVQRRFNTREDEWREDFPEPDWHRLAELPESTPEYIRRLIHERDEARAGVAAAWDEGYKAGAADWAAVTLHPAEVGIANNPHRPAKRWRPSPDEHGRWQSNLPPRVVREGE